ncbi:MAG: hypothetical protein M0Z46_10575 [Actinomycetota bacterium]|jgi:hypothetical protein|nr:hypothetical protein [Actinomycetota bacterium]
MTDLLDDAPPALRCPQCTAEMGSPAGLASHMRSQHDDVVRVPDEPAAEGAITDAKPDKGWRRFFGTKAPKTDRPPAKPKTVRRHKRVNAATVLAIPFEQGGRIIEGWKPCTARVLAWEAGWGGYVLDEAIAGTLPDRLFVQPLARNWERFAMAEAVVGPVALAFAMESRPGAIPILMPEMRRAIRGAAPFMLKAMAKKRVEDAKIEEAFREAYPDAPADATADEMIDTVLQEIFAPLMQRQETTHEPATA